MCTYHGHIQTTADAIKLFEACRLGILPRVQRWLSEEEKQSIKPGSVYVWDEQEARLRRWRDGRTWSSRRVSGGFRIYQEMDGESKRESNKHKDRGNAALSHPGDKLKSLKKRLFSITTSTGRRLHLVSYYSRRRPNSSKLPQPTADPRLRHIIPVEGMYLESTVYESLEPAVAQEDAGPLPTPARHVHKSQHHGNPSSVILQSPMQVYQPNPTPYTEISDKEVAHWRMTLPPIKEMRIAATILQRHDDSQASAIKSSGRLASPNKTIKSDIVVSAAQYGTGIPRLVHDIAVASAGSDNESSSNFVRNRHLNENREQILENTQCKNQNRWINDQKALRVLDRNFLF